MSEWHLNLKASMSSRVPMSEGIASSLKPEGAESLVAA